MNPRNILLKSKSWGDFEKLIKPLNSTDKGFCFALLVRYYLLIDPQYSNEIKNDHVWFATDNPIIPERIKKHIDYPEDIGDEGIDLFAETKEGKIWSIQAKYRWDKNKSLGRTKLSTFTELSLTHCKNIDFLLIATPAESISYKFGKFKKYKEKVSSIKYEVWSGLDQTFFKNLHRYIKKQAVVIKPNDKMKHQEIAIKDAYEHFHTKKQSRGKIIMPCGTGKTLTAYWLADKLKAKNIIVAVPSLNLIRQCLRTWAIESTADKKKVNWIAVCSDQKVKDLNKDDFQVLVKDLGIRAHTKVNEIAAWLKKKKVGKNIIFTTYDSGPHLAKASKKAKFKFDVGIFDEAHRTVGMKNSRNSTLLFDKNIKISKRVFLTATERRFRGKSDEVASMDDKSLYGGKACHFLSYKKALEYKNPPILTDYEIIVLYTSKKEILNLVKKNLLIRPKTGKWDSVIEARTLSNLSILNKTFKDTKAKHCISYHSSIDRAEAFSVSQNNFTKNLKYKTVKTFHVNGRNMTVSKRERLLNSFESTNPSLVTNARCLSEGVDIPKVDTILFADPRDSKVDIVQAVGRALRTEKNKKKSYILLPVMVDEKGIIDGNDYEATANTIISLGSNDNELIDWFDSISKGKVPKKKGKVKFIVPKGVKVDFSNITKSLHTKVYDKLQQLIIFTEEMILDWADKHASSHEGKYPLIKDGALESHPALNWNAIDTALYYGYRGLNGGSSLRKLLLEHRSKELGINLTTTKGLLDINQFSTYTNIFIQLIKELINSGKFKPHGYYYPTSTMKIEDLPPYFKKTDKKRLYKVLGITLDNTKGLLNVNAFKKAIGNDSFNQSAISKKIKPIGKGIMITANGTKKITEFYKPTQVTKYFKLRGVTIIDTKSYLSEVELCLKVKVSKSVIQGLVNQDFLTPIGKGIQGTQLIDYYKKDAVQVVEKYYGPHLDDTKGLIDDSEAIKIRGLTTFIGINKYRMLDELKPRGRYFFGRIKGDPDYLLRKKGDLERIYYYHPDDIKKYLKKKGVTLFDKKKIKNLVSVAALRKKNPSLFNSVKYYLENKTIVSKGKAYIEGVGPPSDFISKKDLAKVKKLMK